jgi:hypothetical protein
MHRLLVTLFVLGTATVAWACPFCTQQGKTLTDEVTQAQTDLVIYGKLVGEKSDEKNETSVIEVEKFIKDDKRRGKGTQVQVKKYLDPSLLSAKDRLLLFCEIYKGQIDAYRGLVVKEGSSLPAYLEGAVKTKGKSVKERLKFFFDYLDDAESEVSMDAYREFANCDYSDFKDLARTLPADKIIKWLKAADTQPFRVGLYASMLGHCGKAEHAAVIKEILADPDRRIGSGVDGLLAAHVMLNKAEGWKAIVEALKNTKEDFSFRYAALRAVRFLREFRTDLVAKKDMVDAVCILLAQDDISDMAIEDLRKWKEWGVADKVLAVQKTAGYKELLVIRRAVLRYCLQCEGHSGAAAYVEARRKEDAEGVKDAEELLKLDAEPAVKPAKEEKK